jgi:tRNA modification GTPase
MKNQRDTIFALSSGRPPAAIAVVRMTGPKSRFGLETLARRVPEPRRASLMRLRDPQDGRALDDALVLWLPGPASETGEDMAELHLHGGRAVIDAVLATLGKLSGLRPAEAGEFTRRAFENGKLDLTAVEALADLVAAETEAQRQQAMGQFEGVLRGKSERWRSTLLDAMALVEAGIDFGDQEDVWADVLSPAIDRICGLRCEIERALSDQHRGERLRDGFGVAIAGPPNAGKSSLLNCLARRDAAIVSPFAGTTRDIIEVHLDLQGYPVTLIDTAGIRTTVDPVEEEGVRRAQARAQSADLVLWVVDASVASALHEFPPDLSVPDDNRAVWIIWNKLDLGRGADSLAGHTNRIRHFEVSCVTGTGIDGLVHAIGSWARDAFGKGEPPLITRQRHRAVLRVVAEGLGRAEALGPLGREDLIAEELRLAARELGRLTGSIDVEEVLEAIFRDFCIGK